VEKVIYKLGFCDLIRGFAVKIDKHPHSPGVTLLGAVAHPGQLQGSHGLLIVIFHSSSPFVCEIDKKLQGEYEKK
jgi:hypothetical protein